MSGKFSPTKYHLQSILTRNEFDDAGWTLDAPGETQASLVRAVYAQKNLRIGDASLGLFKYSDWLPVRRMLEGSATPITYQSTGLSQQLGLKKLFITFSGYWPERSAAMQSCSFKETEAYAVCGRMTPAMEQQVLVVASAGNTARAFAKVCSENHIPLLLCVPFDNINALWFDKPLNDCVKLICAEAGSDYFDAIHLSNMVVGFSGFYAEGGAKNVARRDGMATTMLSATTFIGRIPDYYFQAVGSGTGAIAAWEANLRFIEDGRFGNHKMKLMVSQNAPFLPIYDAWKVKSRQMLPYDDKLARQDVEIIDAKVLSNRRPPYSIIGGLFDALVDSGGEVLAVDNDAARKAAQLFEQTEGIDIHPAAAVATASLMQAVENNQVEKDAVVMLNITGGGEALFAKENDLYYLKPSVVFPVSPAIEEVKEKIGQLSW